MNEKIFRPNETTVIHGGKNEELLVTIFFSISTGNCQFQSTKIVLKRKNF